MLFGETERQGLIAESWRALVATTITATIGFFGVLRRRHVAARIILIMAAPRLKRIVLAQRFGDIIFTRRAHAAVSSFSNRSMCPLICSLAASSQRDNRSIFVGSLSAATPRLRTL
jgi:hypothetical protein